MRFLEERAETLVLLDDSNSVRVLAKDPYTEVKYKMFAGKKIRYVATDGTHTAKIQENEECTEFLCEFEGREVHVDDMVSMARAIIEHATHGNIGPLVKAPELARVPAGTRAVGQQRLDQARPHEGGSPPRSQLRLGRSARAGDLPRRLKGCEAPLHPEGQEQLAVSDVQEPRVRGRAGGHR